MREAPAGGGGGEPRAVLVDRDALEDEVLRVAGLHGADLKDRVDAERRRADDGQQLHPALDDGELEVEEACSQLAA